MHEAFIFGKVDQARHQKTAWEIFMGQWEADTDHPGSLRGARFPTQASEVEFQGYLSYVEVRAFMLLRW